jgi:hypothetical protein
MNQQNVMNWCCEFSKGRTDVHDEQMSGRPALTSDLQIIKGEIPANQRGRIRELHPIIPKVSKTTIHEAVTENCAHAGCPNVKRQSQNEMLKIQVGCIGPSAVQSGPHTQRFPLVSSPKETSC